jgi:hypothetical protein
MEEDKQINYGQECYREQNQWLDAIIFIIDDHLQIYRLGPGPGNYELYASINCKDRYAYFLDVLEENSVHIVRILYDRGNNEEFSLNYYFNFYDIDMKVITEQGKLQEFIGWMDSYYLQFSEVHLNISTPDDLDRLLNLSYRDCLEVTFKDRSAKTIYEWED